MNRQSILSNDLKKKEYWLVFQNKKIQTEYEKLSGRRYVSVIMRNGVFILSNSAFDITLYGKAVLLRLLALRTAFEALEV
jgi:hypothetical protein